MLLAATVEHSTDWRGMIGRMEPWEFEEWIAFYHINPWAVGFPVEPQGEKQNFDNALANMRKAAGV